MDFTLSTYRTLIETLQQQGFSFLSLNEFISKSTERFIILRHDVDSLPANSLRFARIEAEIGIKGTYYFRIVPESFDEKIIKEIYSLGHEVGYHYEDCVFTRQKAKGKRQKIRNRITVALQDCKTARPQDNGHMEEELALIAIESFKENLAKLRELVPVKTICMHGSPMSRWDSRLLWKYYDYRDFGIIGEPYFNVNFDEVLYLTDTGRCWDGDFFNVRDKAAGSRLKAEGNPPPSALCPPPSANFPKFHSTFDIIKAAEKGQLPDRIMMTFHPQRWTDKPVPWVRELVYQNIKNVAKYFLLRMR